MCRIKKNNFYENEKGTFKNCNLVCTNIQIMNVNKGMIKTEHLQPGDKDAAIDIREMGLGNYIICITIGNKVYIGNLELY